MVMKHIYIYIKIIFMLIFLSINICCTTAQDREYDFKPDGKVKKMSIIIYDAVDDKYGVVAGNLLEGDLYVASHDRAYRNNTVIYYDYFNNVLYEEYYIKGKQVPRRTIKTVWYDKERIHAVLERIDNDEDEVYDYFKKKEFKRDISGNLLKITNSEYEGKIEEERRYDSSGNMIERKKYDGDGSLHETTLYFSYDNNGNYRKSHKFASNGELMEELEIGYLPDGKNVQVEYSKGYKYGQLISDLKTEYAYSKTGKMISKYVTGVEDETLFIPAYMSEAEIKEKYYGKNLKLGKVQRTVLWKYDVHDNRVEICSYWDGGAFKDPFGDSPKLSCEKEASYTYNKQGDWTEMAYNYNGTIPSFIVKREIEYFTK